MRVWVMAAAVLLAGPAWAQPVTDGKASVDGKFGEFVQGYLDNLHMPDKGASAFRSIISYAVTVGMTPEYQDAFIEFASGKPVVVTAGPKTINVPPVTDGALATVKMFTAPPNLNTLWKTPGEPILQLVEMSRWGKPAKERVIGFMSNKLYATWVESVPGNGRSAWVQEFNGVKNAMQGIQNQSVQNEAMLLLKAAMESVFVKAKADGREPPAPYLYGGTFHNVGEPKSAP